MLFANLCSGLFSFQLQRRPRAIFTPPHTQSPSLPAEGNTVSGNSAGNGASAPEQHREYAPLPQPGGGAHTPTQMKAGGGTQGPVSEGVVSVTLGATELPPHSSAARRDGVSVAQRGLDTPIPVPLLQLDLGTAG